MTWQERYKRRVKQGFRQNYKIKKCSKLIKYLLSWLWASQTVGVAQVWWMLEVPFLEIVVPSKTNRTTREVMISIFNNSSLPIKAVLTSSKGTLLLQFSGSSTLVTKFILTSLSLPSIELSLHARSSISLWIITEMQTSCQVISYSNLLILRIVEPTS